MNDDSRDDWIVLEVNDEAFNLAEVLAAAQARGQLAFVQTVIDAALIRQAAAQQSIEVSEEELQTAADEFRARHELHKAADLMRWLVAQHLTLAAWETWLEDELLTHKLRVQVSEGQVELHFAQHKLAFESAHIARLVVADESLARELRAQIVEEEADFYALARCHSLDAATRLASGYAGLVRRGDLNSTMEAAVFGARAGAVVGPFKTATGWELIKVQTRQPARLDDATRAQIADALFAEWLAERRRKARIHVPLLDWLTEEEE
jgi:putative peptide maturation system protein